jgi:hypothetical protein
MARKLMLVSVGVLSLCFATAVQAQILVGTLGQHQWPTGCVTIFSGVPFDVFNNSVQIPAMSLTVATSGGGASQFFPGLTCRSMIRLSTSRAQPELALMLLAF